MHLLIFYAMIRKKEGITMAKEQLSAELSARMAQEKQDRTYIDLSCADSMAIRRDDSDKTVSVWRPKFAEEKQVRGCWKRGKRSAVSDPATPP